MSLNNEIDLSVEQLPQNPIILTPSDESDYNNLVNKPKINNVALVGNKTSSDLGLASAEQGEKADSAVQPADLSVYRTSADQDIIDATKATKEELAGYLPLSGGTLSGQLKIERNTLFLTSSDNSKYANISVGKDGFVYFSTKVYLPSNSIIDGSKILGAADKAVANGVASLDANAKVPENQLPESVANQAILREW